MEKKSTLTVNNYGVDKKKVIKVYFYKIIYMVHRLESSYTYISIYISVYVSYSF